MDRKQILLKSGAGILLLIIGTMIYTRATEPIEPFNMLQDYKVVKDEHDIYQPYEKGEYRFSRTITVDGDLASVKKSVSDRLRSDSHWRYSKSTDTLVGMYPHYTYEISVHWGEGGVAIHEDREATSQEAFLPAIKKAIRGQPTRYS